MARLRRNRDLELLASAFERERVHVHGPPAEVSGARSLRNVTSRTFYVATISLSANKVHADTTKRESLSEAMVF
jgi:hypothetical protein